MNNSSYFCTRLLVGVILVGAAARYSAAAQQTAPVPVTNDTPATTARPMPPETTPVQGAGAAAPSTPMTKDQLKAQRKQQRSEEKAASSNAKAAKSSAKAKKQSDKALQDQEKATPTAATPATNPQ